MGSYNIFQSIIIVIQSYTPLGQQGALDQKYLPPSQKYACPATSQHYVIGSRPHDDHFVVVSPISHFLMVPTPQNSKNLYKLKKTGHP